MMEIRDLTLSYGDKTVFRDFSARFPERGSVAVTGKSGSGKSSLLHIIAGINRDFTGTLSGFENKRISVVFQEDRLLPWFTALENVRAAADGGSVETAARYLAEVGLAGEEHRYPRQLSGGMNRRVATARALAFGGDIYLFDEPFNGLDVEIRERIAGRIRTLAENALVIIVSHSREDIESIAGSEIEIPAVTE